MPRLLKWIGGLVALAILAVAVVLGLAANARTVDESRDIGEKAKDAALIEKGRYLAIAGDCTACHTDKGGFEFAGGLPLETPFGTIFATNITPDGKTGIGGWTAGRFEAAMVEGGSFWHPLYPAMPYTSYHLVARDDIDALYAYFMSLKPVDAPAKPNALAFPFDIRLLMQGWNLFFLDRGVFRPDPAKSDIWNRGAYLAEGLGHCGECHTPRGRFGQLEASNALAGAIVNGLSAPDIRPATLKQVGWTRDDLIAFFRRGAGDKGSAFGEMFAVVKDSLRHLTAEDQTALAVYLLDQRGDEPSKGEAAVAAAPPSAGDRKGAGLYLTHCSLCHGAAGQGVPNVFPPLRGNETVAEADGVNLVTAIAHGIAPERLSLTDAYGPMPGFADRIGAEDMTALVNYLRMAFAPPGIALAPLSVAEVQRIAGE
jgi:mono/diheme cytochrome c family protein